MAAADNSLQSRAMSTNHTPSDLQSQLMQFLQAQVPLPAPPADTSNLEQRRSPSVFTAAAAPDMLQLLQLLQAQQSSSALLPTAAVSSIDLRHSVASSSSAAVAAEATYKQLLQQLLSGVRTSGAPPAAGASSDAPLNSLLQLLLQVKHSSPALPAPPAAAMSARHVLRCAALLRRIRC